MQAHIDIIGAGAPILDTLAFVDDAFLNSIHGKKGGMELLSSEAFDALVTRLPGECSHACGGSAGNTIFTMARLGCRTRFLGKLGSDQAGAEFLNRFLSIGGDGEAFKQGPGANARCLSLITPDGQRTMRTDLGASATLCAEELSEADFAGCRHCHIEGYLLHTPPFVGRILELASGAGATVSLDLASFEVVHARRAELKRLLQGPRAGGVDLVFANEDEAQAWFGPGAGLEKSARLFAAPGLIGVVKCGAQGAFVAHAEAVHRIAPVPVKEVVDTTGAGDFWAAGFLYAWLRGASLPECGALGSQLGAAVVQQLGTEGVPLPSFEPQA